MIVKHIVNQKTDGKWVWEKTEVPEGSWVVILKNVQTDLDNERAREEGEDESVWLYSNSTSYMVINGPEGSVPRGPRVHELVRSRTFSRTGEYDGPACMHEHILFWSNAPFVVIEHHDDALGIMWAHLATRVNVHGVTNQLPEFVEPEYSIGPSSYDKPDHVSKWCRLSDLSHLTGLEESEIIKLHWCHVRGFSHGNMHYLVADSQSDLTSEMKIRNSYGYEWITELNVSKVWVRRHFALIVLYLHHIGWQTKKASSAA